METPTDSAISLIPADFASTGSALERVARRRGASGGLRVDFGDFGADIDES
jgi:hypothetical protein